MSELRDAILVDAVRTPIGRHGGALSTVRPDDLAAAALAGLIDHGTVPHAEVEDVTLGCANQAGEDNRNVARMAALLAGLPESVAGTTVNRLCGSGLDAIASAARQVMVGDGEVHVAGGVESMSRAPFVLPKPERGFPTGHRSAYDTTLGWRLVNPRMEALGHTEALGMTAENLVAESLGAGQGPIPERRGTTWDSSREAQDELALASHRKAIAAADAGRYDAELLAVGAPRLGGEEVVDVDEGPRRDTTLEKLGRLPPAFAEGGTVTAGNSSPLSDGAAAAMIASGEYVRAHGLAPLARIRAIAAAGVPPRVMGLGPVPAVRKALARSGLGLDDIGLIEVNEAFAAQVLAVVHEWGLDHGDERLNPNGGAIALGHPLGASGARIVATLAHEMRRRGDVQFGVATMCIGVGQGIAVVLESVR